MTQPRRREPFMVEVFPTHAGTVLLVAYDGRGDVLLEVRAATLAFDATFVNAVRALAKVLDQQAGSMHRPVLTVVRAEQLS